MRNNSEEIFGSLVGFTHVFIHMILPLLSEKDIFYLTLSCHYFWRIAPKEMRENFPKYKIPSLLSFNVPLLESLAHSKSAPSLGANRIPVLSKVLKAISAPTLSNAKDKPAITLCGIVFSNDAEYYGNLFKRLLENEAIQTHQQVETNAYECKYQFKKIPLNLSLLSCELDNKSVKGLSCELDNKSVEGFFPVSRLIYIVIDLSDRDFFENLPFLLSRIRSHHPEIPPICTLVIKESEIKNENIILAEEIFDFCRKQKIAHRYWLNPADKLPDIVSNSLRVRLWKDYPDVRAEKEAEVRKGCNIC